MSDLRGDKPHTPRKTDTDRIHDAFYRWFGRRHPERNSLIADGFTRRDMRDAYEAGVRAQCRAIKRKRK